MKSLIGVMVWLARDAFRKHSLVVKEACQSDTGLVTISVHRGAEGLVATAGGRGGVIGCLTQRCSCVH